MEWEVEYTDEFGDLWTSLTETEQEDVAAVIELLEEKGLSCPTHTVPGSMGQNTPICENCEFSMLEDPTGPCMPLIPVAWPFS